MRELELWKDKIQLRIRDRIQSSMEQFTRECLEVDKHANEENSEMRQPGSTSMEQIYIRAAKLVKRTLDPPVFPSEELDEFNLWRHG